MPTRYDGYKNAVIGHGLKNKDPAAHFGFTPGPILTDQVLSNLFLSNSIARKIISLPADEAVKNWITIDDDPESKPMKILDDMGAEGHFADALRWGRLYGGSVVLMLANDGGGLEDPLREGSVKEVECIRVYDKTQVFWNDAVLYEDPRNKRYGEPEYYEINPIEGMPFMVHESRLLLFKGDPLPDYYRLRYQGWGLPSLQGLWNELLHNSHAHSLAIMIMERMSQGVLKLDKMLETLEGEGGDQLIKDRLELIDMARSILNTIAIDKEDEFELKDISLAQIPELLDRFGLAVSAASNMPFTLLFGRSPAGMNATGESDFENYYNMVRQIQKRQVKPHLSRLIRLISGSREALKLTFAPLWLPSEKEQAETDKMKAEAKEKDANTANIYVSTGALDPSEVRKGLAERGEFDIDLSINPIEPTPEELKQEDNPNGTEKA